MATEPKSVKDIFLAAIEKAAGAERAAYLMEACAGDAALHQRVEALLKANDEPGNILDKPAVEIAPPEGLATTEDEPKTEAMGTVIGPYKLLQQLGEGGMGTVFMAEQTEPVQRKVALKIIKPGSDTRQVIARFEQERQALAMMDHPNIAKVLDAGTTAAGRPYFVMELVKGIRITKYCDQQHLTLQERLELFIPVCQAVQHAHQKGIIHRDLKPSNVLIALYDGKPIPKVIDFGVAKATAQKLTERTMFTEVGQIVGTLEYMAPEQAELNNLDIDTRADIYSLGALLYRLLAGTPPFTSEQLRGVAFDEMLRIIREVEPPKPSTKISSSHELPLIAAQRKLEPKKLTKLVKGELDWIVMKALEKPRGRRYETANGLATDIQHFLANEPVLAGPPSATYRLRKLVQRNKPKVVLSILLLVTLITGIVGTTVGLFRALTAEEVAKDEATHARNAERIARERLAEVAAQKERAERHLRLLADALAPVNQTMDQSGLYHLFKEYLIVGDPDDSHQAFQQRIEDVERALRDLPEDITKKVQLSRARALHYLKYALYLEIEPLWQVFLDDAQKQKQVEAAQKLALQYFDKAVKMLEQDCCVIRSDETGRITGSTINSANSMIWPVLRLAYAERGDVLHLLGRYEKANDDYMQALAGDPADHELRLRYSDNLFALRWYEGAVAEGEKLFALSNKEIDWSFPLQASKSFAAKVALLGNDAQRADRFAGLALRWLRRALEQGHSAQEILNALQFNEEFEALRSRPEFQKLIKELESKPISK
jgi:serine/threonine protein kinase